MTQNTTSIAGNSTFDKIVADKATSLKTDWTAVARGADATVEALSGQYWATTDKLGINWLYVRSIYSGGLATSNVATLNGTARFFQWVSFAEPNTTAPKYEIAQCSTTFRAGAEVKLTDNTFGLGYSTVVPANPPSDESFKGTTAFWRDTDWNAQTWNGTATTTKGAFVNECAMRRPWTMTNAFSLKVGNTIKTRAAAYTKTASTAAATNLVGGAAEWDLIVPAPLNAVTITSAMASAVALTLLM